jgi:thiol-disulfide isomerase/thioredoxin
VRAFVYSTLLFSSFLNGSPCDPPTSVARLLRALPHDKRDSHDALGELVNLYPGDFWINRLFLDSSLLETEAIRNRYKSRFDASSSINDEYLYARSLVGFHSEEALRLYGEILKRNLNYPWVHYSQLQIYSSPAFHDRAKLLASFDTITRVCRAWIEPYRFLTGLEDNTLPIRASRFRTLLASSTETDELKLYTSLWSSEFRIQPRPEVEKQRIANDLRRLQALDAPHSLIAIGARLIGDTVLAHQMTPPPKPNLSVLTQAWQRDHPYPPRDASPEQRHRYAQAELEASTRWTLLDPNAIVGSANRFDALVMLAAPAPEILRAGDGLLLAARRQGGSAGAGFILDVARKYFDLRIALDQIPSLIHEALVSFDEPQEGIDLSPTPSLTEAHRMDAAWRHVAAVVLLSEYYERTGDSTKARAVLASLPAFLANKTVSVLVSNGPASLVADHESAKSSLAFAHYSYWMRLAELDESEGITLSALNEYRQALIAMPRLRETILAKQRRLWKDLGRSDEAWQIWVDTFPKEQQPLKPTIAFFPVHRILPTVTLKDINGNEWTIDRFASKITIAVVWATWCEPCRRELPLLAHLDERLKGDPRVQVISFNTDENPEVARAFVQEKAFTFPVLAAKNFAEDLMPFLSIPRTWLIQDGAIVEECEGFDVDGWTERILEMIRSRLR